jgi:hypothetical protein
MADGAAAVPASAERFNAEHREAPQSTAEQTALGFALNTLEPHLLPTARTLHARRDTR